MPFAKEFTVNTSDPISATNFHTIQSAVDAATPNTLITVAAGTYVENVTIGTNGITLVSAEGRESTIITGTQGGGSLGTIVLSPNTNNVTIGGTGAGFTINGIDGPSAAIESGAIYLQGAHNNIIIQGNEVVAKGDAGLMSETTAIRNITVDGNIFSGQTFTGTVPGGDGFGSQFTTANVPRQLVVLGTNGGNSANITFTNNDVTGTAGGLNAANQPQGNTLVTIDARDSVISGNDFSGFTNRFATQLRVREEDTVVTDNTFINAADGNIGLLTDFTLVEGPGETSGNHYTYGAGNNVVTATFGDDMFDGGAGVDTWVVNNTFFDGVNVVDLETGFALSEVSGYDELTNFENIAGSNQRDVLLGDGGDNTFFASGDSDVINGRGGSDTFEASNTNAAISADLDTGAVSGAYTAALTDVENIKSGGGNDTVHTSDADNTVSTAGGNDLVYASAGADDYDLGTGSDKVIFSEDRDAYSITWDGTDAIVKNTATGDTTTVSNAEILEFANSKVILVDGGSTGFSTIQAAVDASSDGDEIFVAGGTYVEQVIVDGFANLSITSTDGAILQAPANVVETVRSSADRELNAVLSVVDSTNVVITGLTVDGDGRAGTVDENGGAGQANFVGVVFRNATGGLEDVTITGIRDAYPGGLTDDGFPVVSGVQRGVGLQVDNDSLLSFFMHGGSIEDFQKNAAVIKNADLDISGVTVTGGGAQTIIAQNGIQVTLSTGSISGNTITDIGYAGPADAYSALVLAYGNTDLDMTDNTLVGANEANTDAKAIGIYIADFGTPNSGGSVTGNTFSFLDEGIDLSGRLSPNSILIEDNSVTNVDETDPYAVGLSFNPDPTLSVVHDVDGTDVHDQLSGGAADDILSGLGGDDLINGKGGADDLSGGDGDDTFIVESVADFAAGESVDGGADDDTIVFASASGGTLVLTDDVTNVEIVQISVEGPLNLIAMNIDASAVENGLTINGNGAANTIVGTAFADDLNGGGGADAMTANGGDDSVDGGSGLDTVTLTGNRSEWTITWDGTTATADNGTDTVTITDAGRLTFDDMDVFLVDDASSEYATIQSAVNAAANGDEILVANGSYAGATITDKAIAIVGSGNAVNVTGAFAVTDDMAAGDEMRFANLNINATGQQQGISVRSSSADIPGVNGGTIILDGVDISNARTHGFFYSHPSNGSNPTNPDTVGTIEILNSTFAANGEIYSGARGQGHVNLFGFNGNLAVEDSSFASTATNQGDAAFRGGSVNTPGAAVNADKAISVTGIRTGVPGQGGYVDAGTLVLNGVTVAGLYSTDALSFYTVQSFASVTISDVEVNGKAPWGQLNADDVGGTFDASGISGTMVGGFGVALQGLSSDDTFTGTDGADLLDGRGGADNLSGGGGDDTFRIMSASHGANDTMDGGSGTDTVVFASASGGTLVLDEDTTDVEVVTLAGGALNAVAMNVDASAVETGLTLNGNGAANQIVGTGAADTVNAGGGNDTVTSGGGDDTVDGGSGSDTVIVEGDATFAVVNGDWQVTTAEGGVDTLTNVENVTDGSGANFLLVGEGGYATIQDALNAAQDGDTILLAPGEYSGNFTISVDNLTIRGVGDPGDVVILGTFETDNSITGDVADFFETALGYSTAAGTAITVAADGVTIENLTIDSFATGIEVGNGSDALTVRDVDITDGLHGISKAAAATVNDLTIEGGTLSDLYIGILMPKALDAPGRVDGLTVDGTAFVNLGEKGIYLETGSNVLITGISMDDVGQFGRGPAFAAPGQVGEFGNGIDINLKYDFGTPYENIVIEDFDFTNVGASAGVDTVAADFGGAIVIKARNDFPSYHVNAAFYDGEVTVRNGSIDGTSTGIRAGEPGKNIADPAVTIENVTILDATVAPVDNVTQSTMTITLGDGDDSWAVSSTTTGDVVIDGGDGADNLQTGPGNDALTGGDGADTLSGGNGDDNLSGLDGDDDLFHGDGDDTVDGGDGIDTVTFDGAWSDYTITRDGATYTITGFGFTDTVTNVEKFIFNGVTVDVTEDPDPITSDSAPAVVSIEEDGIDEDDDTATFDVLEGSATDTAIAIVTADDANLPAGDELTFALVDDQGDAFVGPFTITKTGDVTAAITVSGSLDFLTDDDHVLFVKITDAAGNSATQQVTINVLDVNDAPTDIVFGDDTPDVNEVSDGAMITTVSGVDQNAGDTLTYSVDDARFEVVEDDGTYVLKLKTGEELDFETEESVDLEVTVTDSEGETFTKSLTVTVNDVNEAPGGGGALAVWTPNAVQSGLRRAQLFPEAVVTDPEGDTLTYTLVTGPSSGTLYLGDVVLTAGLELTEAEFHALTYGAPAQGTYGATFEVSDGENEAALNVTLNVSAAVKDFINGTVAPETLDGGGANDTIYGLQGSDTLYGGAGKDQLFGGKGNDILYGSAEDDVLRGNQGADTLRGGGGADELIGGSGPDLLIGAGGRDSLRGGDGADTLDGGKGKDFLFGDSGKDVFVFNSTLVDGKEDTIADFKSGTDTIQLAKSVFAALGASVSAGEFHQGTSAQDGNDHLVYTKSTGELFYDANGSENGGLHLFARLDAGATLTFSDFDIL